MLMDSVDGSSSSPEEHTPILSTGVSLCYQVFGAKESPQGVLLMVMGLAGQMMSWPSPLIARFVALGFRVVRFDNRDIGLSTHFTEHDGVTLVQNNARLAMAALGLPRWAIRAATLGSQPYALSAMADDAVALLDHLGVERAHILGASMGGMIAQHILCSYPTRVRSATLVMTSPGGASMPRPNLAWLAAASEQLSQRASNAGTPAGVDAGLAILDLFAAPHRTPRPSETPWIREHIIALDARKDAAADEAGTRRQLAAIVEDGSRAHLLATHAAGPHRDIPVAIVHGSSDPLVPVGCGRALHSMIHGATFSLFNEMGHDLPESVWEELAQIVLACANDVASKQRAAKRERAVEAGRVRAAGVARAGGRANSSVQQPLLELT